jgi:putative membrane-bound dehydrogenase-like protein
MAVWDDGFVPLFNGKDLAGWSGDSTLWRVEDGVIIGTTDQTRIKQNSFLSTERRYADFVLRVKVKLRNHNSGIQFRSEQHPGYVVAGYQADVADANYFGMLYEEQKRGFMPYWKELSQDDKDALQRYVKKGDWNEYEITCRGNGVTLKLNGHVTCNINDPGGALSGVIALQLHAGDSMEVQFKDIYLKELPTDTNALLMADFDATRNARAGMNNRWFRAPSGFVVEQVASHDVIGSVINLTFDHLGRPVVGHEREGVRILLDTNGDGLYDAQQSFSEEVGRPMALSYIEPGDLLVQAEGPEGPGLYRLTDTDGDDEADRVELIGKSDTGVGEHGPHGITKGPDGHYYVIFGNHGHPIVELDPLSPSRGLEEDHLLPRYLDPNRHANTKMAPGGAIYRMTPGLKSWSRVLAGFRNAFDFAMDDTGEIFTFDSDMEWDIGMPWYRPVRVLHTVPSGDYGWRTGSSKMPDYYLDTLPALDDVGRGSPVGTCFYQHHVYPDRYRGALFMGDWSLGKLLVLFPQSAGATYTGKALDFVVGAPMNITDVAVGPDGAVYFTVGGRNTQGGLFRVRYEHPAPVASPASAVAAVLDQPMPRSAWGSRALAVAKESMGTAWEKELVRAARNKKLDSSRRWRALQALKLHDPAPEYTLLKRLTKDNDPSVRAGALFLLGDMSLAKVRRTLVKTLDDEDALVVRRASEALVRAGLEESTQVPPRDPMVPSLLTLLDHSDRTVRHAARHALMRVDRRAWAGAVLQDDIDKRPHGSLEGLLALIMSHDATADAGSIFERLEVYSRSEMPDEILLDYLRVTQLAYLRLVEPEFDHSEFAELVGPRLLRKFPTRNKAVNRELQVVLAHMQTPGVIDAMLAYCTSDMPQEEQVHTIYCLRAIRDGWSAEQRNVLVTWFDEGRKITGAASAAGYINDLWESTLDLLPPNERQAALAREEEAIRKREESAEIQMASIKDKEDDDGVDLAEISFDELSNYLENDPLAREVDLERGKRAFIRSLCANCHVFGTVGKGGGPDLSTVASRFGRKEILESIMYPSRVVSDQYSGVDLVLDDFSSVTGMIAGESSSVLMVITIDGERVNVPKASIMTREKAEGSAMPSGLLDTMNLSDLAALINYLESGAAK